MFHRIEGRQVVTGGRAGDAYGQVSDCGRGQVSNREWRRRGGMAKNNPLIIFSMRFITLHYSLS